MHKVFGDRALLGPAEGAYSAPPTAGFKWAALRQEKWISCFLLRYHKQSEVYMNNTVENDFWTSQGQVATSDR